MGADKQLLSDNSTVLKSGPPPEIEDIEGKHVPPETSFDFGRLDEADLRGFDASCLATSADWEQHEMCDGVKGALQRARGRKHPEEHIYRAPVAAVGEPFYCETTKRSLAIQSWHWPELGNLAHTHLLLREGASRTEKKAARSHARLKFTLV